MRVLGIDPGTRAVGYGVVEDRDGGLRLCEAGTIRLPEDRELGDRLVAIADALGRVLSAWAPEAAAVENVYLGRNPRAALVIGEGRGVALLAAARAGVPVCGYEPARLKRALCGNGRAAKRQVQAMVQALLELETPLASDHEADAAALALCHLRHARADLPHARRALPEAVRRALGDLRPRGRSRKRRPLRARRVPRADRGDPA